MTTPVLADGAQHHELAVHEVVLLLETDVRRGLDTAEAEELDDRITAEWKDLPAHVKSAFAAQKPADVPDVARYYRAVRADMVAAGWAEPALIWRAVVRAENATLLGEPIVYGVHPALLDTLGALRTLPGDSQAVALLDAPSGRSRRLWVDAFVV